MRPLNTRLRTAICTKTQGLHAIKPSHPAELLWKEQAKNS